ncbi:MAG: exodeoxyribonuclease VII small subunit [Candidatus Neomarinimicrobiota bacterium]
MAKKTKPIAFEAAFQRLETIVQQLEDGNLPLEENLKLFEEGVELTRSCQEQLTQAEEKIKTLIKQTDGSFALEDLD